MSDLLVIFLAWAWPALVAILLASAVIHRALFADKARGRRRCPRCWHDLSRTPGLTCGECGRVAADEREFARTRRRWGMAVAAVLAAMAVAAVTQHSILNATWAASVPDWVLVRLPALRPFRDLPGAARRELALRVGTGTLAADELLELARSLGAHGPVGSAQDAGAVLLNAVSEALPAGLEPSPDLPAAASRARAEALEAWRTELDALLASMPLWAEVAAPLRWPRGEPAVAYVRATVWGPRTEWRVRRRGSDGPWVVGAGIAGLRKEPLPVAVDAGAVGPDGRLAAAFDLEVRRGERGSPDWGPWTAAAPLHLDAPVAVTEPGSITEVRGPEIDRLVAMALGSPIILWDDPARPAAFRLDLPRLADLGTPVAVGMLVELCEGAIVRRRLRVSATTWGTAHAWALELEDARGLAALRPLAERAGPDPVSNGAALPGWTVRVRSDRRLALEALGRARTAGEPTDAIWSGAVELPAFGIPSPESPPPRSYRMEFSDDFSRNVKKP